MAKHIYHKKFAPAWTNLVATLLRQGEESSPREQKTREILNVSFEVENCLSNILVSKPRDLNYRFMIAEWLWIQAGLNDVGILSQYNSRMKEFSDDGQILSGAYGPRLMPQLPYVLDALSKLDSRQAVATIWTPSPTNSKDIPCTVSLQWLLRKEVLHCVANMRSSDVWLGLPYDFFTFSQLTNFVAMSIGAHPGSLTMNLASSHIYEQHWSTGREAVMDEYETVDSPYIPSNECVPTSEHIIGMLNRDQHCYIDPFWHNYRKALYGNKAQALEVLRAISPRA